MKKSGTPYHPIPCADYSRYECAIVQNQQLRLAWQDRRNLLQLHKVKPVDLLTRASEEFIIVLDEENHQHQVRLDYICHCAIISNLT